jgi:hypothetical protein
MVGAIIKINLSFYNLPTLSLMPKIKKDKPIWIYAVVTRHFELSPAFSNKVVSYLAFEDTSKMTYLPTLLSMGDKDEGWTILVVPDTDNG